MSEVAEWSCCVLSGPPAFPQRGLGTQAGPRGPKQSHPAASGSAAGWAGLTERQDARHTLSSPGPVLGPGAGKGRAPRSQVTELGEAHFCPGAAEDKPRKSFLLFRGPSPSSLQCWLRCQPLWRRGRSPALYILQSSPSGHGLIPFCLETSGKSLLSSSHSPRAGSQVAELASGLTCGWSPCLLSAV